MTQKNLHIVAYVAAAFILTVWSAGTQVFALEKRPRSQESVPHAEQWKTVASVSAARRADFKGHRLRHTFTRFEWGRRKRPT